MGGKRFPHVWRSETRILDRQTRVRRCQADKPGREPSRPISRMPGMRRPGRTLFTILSAVSLLLCVGTCVLWVRSYWCTEMIGTWNQVIVNGTVVEACRGVVSSQGAVGVAAYQSEQGATECAKMQGAVPVAFSRRGWIANAPAYPVELRDDASLLGFFYARQTIGSPPEYKLEENRHFVRIPYWFIVLLFAVAPALRPYDRLRQQLRRRREIMRGPCTTCGYDLRASPERCPECGAAIDGKTKQLQIAN